MANSEKNILITPNVGSANSDPTITFSAASLTGNARIITLKTTLSSNSNAITPGAALSFEGNTGQILTIIDDMSNVLFGVNDSSGIPALEVYADGRILFTPYGGSVGIGGNIYPSSKVTVAGVIESTTGGFKFPDGSTQIAAFAATNAFSRINVIASGSINANTSSSNILIANANVSVTANTVTNTITFDLINTAVSAGSYGNATIVPVISVDSKGRITSASNAEIAPSVANIVLTGDVAGSANAILTPSTTVISISTTIQPDSVALGTDTTGNYTDRIIAGTGTTVSGTVDEGNVITVGLTNTGVSPTTYGNATIVPVITVDAQGRITSASNVTISLPAAGASNAFTTINVSASGNVIASTATSSVFFANSNVSITANVQNNTITFDLVDTNVTPGVYGNTTLVPQITVDSKGRITSLSNIAVTTGTLSTQYIGNLVAGTGVSITGLTGAPNTVPTISIGQDVATSAGVTFGTLTVSGNANVIGNITLNSLADVKTYMEVETSPTISAGTLTLDLNNSTIFDVSLNGSITTLTINNTPSTASRAVSFVLIFTADGTPRTVAWPGSFRWPSATAPTITSTLNKRDIFTFMSTDNGTSWNAFITGQNL